MGSAADGGILIPQGYITLINKDENKDYTVDRREMRRATLTAVGIVFDPELTIRGKNTIHSGHAAMKTLLAQGDFSAIFCVTDVMAIEVMNALYEAGLQAPEGMPIVGYDGGSPLDDPPLTTICRP